MRLIFLVIILQAYSSSVSGQEIERKDSGKVDSVFNKSFEVLELYLKDINSDPSLRRIEIVHFFETISGITASSDGTYVGKVTFSADNIKSWRNWYTTNKQKLRWDPIQKKIVKLRKN